MIKKLLPIVYIKNKEKAIKYKAVLCLDNFYFTTFKISIENVINNEDRILKIEENLSIHFSNYNSSDFILNYEILERYDDSEEIVVYIFNKNLVDERNIIDDINKYQFLSIIPSFFKAREFKNNPNFYNFDIGLNSIVISKYSSTKLEDISTFQAEQSLIVNDNMISNFSYIEFINNFLANIENDYDVVFTGEKINTSELNLRNINFSFFDVENIDFKKYPNFLPKYLQKKYFFYYLNLKYLLTMFLITIFSFFIYFILIFKISSSEENLINLQINSAELEEKNKNLRDKIAEIEKIKLEFEYELSESKKIDFKISSFLEDLKLINSKNIIFSLIEYNGEDRIDLIGTAPNLASINLLLSNIQNSKDMELINYDYILEKEENIEFKLEIKYNNKF